jgi:hypothetical protein
MLKDLIVIPNFFDNPEQIIKIAKEQKYYSVDAHPEDKDTRVSWGGFRTEKLENILDDSINSLIKETVIKKIFSSDLPDQTTSIVKYWGHSFFHYFTQNYQASQKHLHQDSGLYAGVIYLNDCKLDSPEKHGTIVFNDAKDSFIMPYEYNTAIFYRSDFVHSPLEGFGSTVNDARLSMSFFIEKVIYDLHRNTL